MTNATERERRPQTVSQRATDSFWIAEDYYVRGEVYDVDEVRAAKYARRGMFVDPSVELPSQIEPDQPPVDVPAGYVPPEEPEPEEPEPEPEPEPEGEDENDAPAGRGRHR
jgi:hypothetical protein